MSIKVNSVNINHNHDLIPHYIKKMLKNSEKYMISEKAKSTSSHVTHGILM